MSDTARALQATELNEKLQDASPAEVISAALDAVGRDRLAVVSSFGTQSGALLKIVADVDPDIPVIFIDTGWMFVETLQYRDALVDQLGLRDVRSVPPQATTLASRDPDADLWSTDPDACCQLRKVEPLNEAMAAFDASINGRKRFQAATRADIPIVELDGQQLKFNPFAQMTLRDIESIYATADLPQHPLVAAGFSSIGCMPCTSRTLPGEDPRAGRWRGRAKTECGIHRSS
jgi:phosphoadenosine phosphosulfate reductase